MKGFRIPKSPSKADLEKRVKILTMQLQGMTAQAELYKKIAMRMRACETLEELKELWEAMKTAKESVIFANKWKDWKLYDDEGNELLTDQELEEESQPVHEAEEPQPEAEQK